MDVPGFINKLNKVPRRYYYVVREPASRFVNERKPLFKDKPMIAMGIVLFILSTLALAFMTSDMVYFYVALMSGVISFTFDYLIEYSGMKKGKWDYPRSKKGLFLVPLEVPLLFFFTGIIATFLIFVIQHPALSDFTQGHPWEFLSLPQIILIAISGFFMYKYFTGRFKSLIFWALPLSLAAYMSFPEPWILFLSVLPVYIDYYLEKSLVPSDDIRYRAHDESVAINVAVSYFFVALLVFIFIMAMLTLFA